MERRNPPSGALAGGRLRKPFSAPGRSHIFYGSCHRIVRRLPAIEQAFRADPLDANLSLLRNRLQETRNALFQTIAAAESGLDHAAGLEGRVQDYLHALRVYLGFLTKGPTGELLAGLETQ